MFSTSVYSPCNPFLAFAQIYVKGEFIGGSDLLMEMHQKGELETVFRDAQQ